MQTIMFYILTATAFGAWQNSVLAGIFMGLLLFYLNHLIALVKIRSQE